LLSFSGKGSRRIERMIMSKIEWTDITINPIVGCSKISPGCYHCYAEKMAYRLKCMGVKKYQAVVDENGWTGKIGVDFSDTFKKLPKKPKKIFVSSMGDLFHEKVNWNDQYKIFEMAYLYQYHTFILLTKRPQNLLRYYDSIFFHLKRNYNFGGEYRENIWLGVTAENQKRADERIPILLQIPAAVRFVSVEPMLERVNIFSGKYIDINNPQWVDWVICGPETGPGARPCKPEWIEDLYEQCKAAGVPFFDKRKTGWLAREFPKEPK
jgi:protein gp37